MIVVSTVLGESDPLKMILNRGKIINYPCWGYVGEIYLFCVFFISGSVRHYPEISTRIPPGEFNFTIFRLQVMSLEVFFNALTAI
jgi:hypothetical protein